VSDKSERFDALFDRPIPKSVINESVDFTVDFAAPPLTARERALRRWRMGPESGDQHE
jgi:hypothetical protein